MNTIRVIRRSGGGKNQGHCSEHFPSNFGSGLMDRPKNEIFANARCGPNNIFGAKS